MPPTCTVQAAAICSLPTASVSTGTPGHTGRLTLLFCGLKASAKLRNDNGMQPASRLLLTLSAASLERSPSSAGIDPVSELLWSTSVWSLERSPSSAGIEPVSELLDRSSEMRLERSPSSAGIEPVSELLWSTSEMMLERSPSSAGIEPASEVPARSTASTRRPIKLSAPNPNTSTPIQESILVPVSQLSAVPVPTSVASDASSTSQSSTSPPLVSPLTAVDPAQPKPKLTPIVNSIESAAASEPVAV